MDSRKHRGQWESKRRVGWAGVAAAALVASPKQDGLFSGLEVLLER